MTDQTNATEHTGETAAAVQAERERMIRKFRTYLKTAAKLNAMRGGTAAADLIRMLAAGISDDFGEPIESGETP
jgi:hypothetical protein